MYKSESKELIELVRQNNNKFTELKETMEKEMKKWFKTKRYNKIDGNIYS